MNDSVQQDLDEDIEPSENNDHAETTQIEVISEQNENDDSQWNRTRPKFKSKEIIVHEDGSRAVILRTLKTTTRRGRFAWNRKTFYRVEESVMQLDESAFIEPHLVKFLDFEPVAGEDRIHLLNRRSWWEHGPYQLIVLFGFLALIVVSVILGVSSAVPLSYLFVLGVLSAAVASGIYFFVWMHWAYEYLLITNKRLGLIYRPPFGLVGTGPMSFLNKLTLNEANDQSWFANVIGKRNPAYRYGKLNLDTNAQEDEWMREIPFVRQHTEVRELIAGLIADAEVIEVRESDDQITSRELQDKAHRAMIKHFGDPDE